jgi:Fanconi-associated nuclease 1
VQADSVIAEAETEIAAAAAAIAAIHRLLERAVAAYAGRRITGIDWEAYTLDDLRAIATAVGGAALAVIAWRLVVDGASWSGGLPDLLLIRDADAPASEGGGGKSTRELGRAANAGDAGGAGGRRTAMLVEVKSERDRLSDQQRAWLLCLHAHRVPVLVCRVRENAAHVRRDEGE